MAVVSGRVLDAAGAPVEHARVGFADAPLPVADVAALTGPDGRFALSAPGPGRYAIFGAAEGHPAAQMAVDVHGDDPVKVELTLGGEVP